MYKDTFIILGLVSIFKGLLNYYWEESIHLMIDK